MFGATCKLCHLRHSPYRLHLKSCYCIWNGLGPEGGVPYIEIFAVAKLACPAGNHLGSAILFLIFTFKEFLISSFECIAVNSLDNIMDI